MKASIYFVVIFSITAAALHSVAGAAEVSEPKELLELKAKYQREIAPITKRHLARLDKLKKKFGAAGDLTSALAVQAEIELLSSKAKPAKQRSIIGKYYMVDPNGIPEAGVYMELHRDGRLEVKGEAEWSGKYTFLDSAKTKFPDFPPLQFRFHLF